MYSEKVKQLVAQLPNSGEVPDWTHRSAVENPICGDVTRLSMKVMEGVVVDCRFQTRGCPAAIAAAAAAAAMCRGKSPQACVSISVDQLVDCLDGLPPHKMHGAELAVEAVRQALA